MTLIIYALDGILTILYSNELPFFLPLSIGSVEISTGKHLEHIFHAQGTTVH